MMAIVDPDRDASRILAGRLRRLGNKVMVCSGLGAIPAAVEAGELAMLLLDLRLASGDDWTRLGEWKEGGLAAEVILLASQPPTAGFLRRLPDWVSDCVSKPVSEHGLVWMNRRARLVARASALCRRWNLGFEGGGPAGIEGLSRATERWRCAVVQAAPGDAPRLIAGEPGSGRRLSAHCMHAHAGRMAQPFVTLDLAGMTRDGVETELLGNGGRMGLFELARGGTLLLREIDRLPSSAQAALGTLIRAFRRRGTGARGLRLLGTVGASVATAEAAELLHPGLSSQFEGETVRVPSLRERADDIPFLVRQFLEMEARREGSGAPTLDSACRAALERYSWPGNVHELRLLTRRALWLGKGSSVLEARHFGLALVPTAGSGPPPGRASSPDPYRNVSSVAMFPTLDQLEWQHITAALAQTAGNRTHAARLLGITSRTLRNKLRWARLGRR